MDKLVQIIFIFAAIISLRLNEFFIKSPLANTGNAHAVTTFAEVAQANALALNGSPGMQIIDFQANRTTFGFADANYTQPFDPNLANKKVALGCDSVLISLEAVVAGISVNDSLGFKITYSNPGGSLSNNQLFLFDKGQVTFKKGNNSFNCNVNTSALNVSTTLGVKTLNFNLHNCLTGLGITLQNGDTVRFSGKFVVNADGPLTPNFLAVPNFNAYSYATQNGIQLICDTLSDTFTLAKSEVIFDFPNTLNGLPIGCNSGKLTWRLFVPNNDFNDYFGSELRPATKVDSLVFDFDPGLLTAFTGGSVQVSIPGHPVFGNNYFSIRPLSDFPDGHYVAVFDTLAFVPSLNNVQTYTYDLRVNLKPTCKSGFGSLAGDNIYGIQSSVSYTDRYYAHFIGDGNCVNAQTDQATSSVAYNQAPDFTLAAVTSANAPLVGGVATWDVLLCNTSAQSASGVNWIQVEDPTGLLDVTSINNINNPSNPIPLTLLANGQNVFAITNGINSAQCLKLRITTTTTSCDDVPLLLTAGFDCTTYPNGWTPNDNAPCSSTSLPLSIQNNGVASFQIAFTSVNSTCNVTGETVAIQGKLTSATSLPSDAYTVFFVLDENGDGAAGTNETILSQQSISGPVSAGNPLIFNQLLNIQPNQACQVLVKIESSASTACSTVTAAMPLPGLQNAGNDISFCDANSIFSSTLGAGPVCDTTGYQFTWLAISPASLAYLSAPNIASPDLTFDPLNHVGQTLRYILTTQRTGCGSSSDTVQIFVPNGSAGFFDDEMIDIQIADCQSFATYCTNIPLSILADFSITDNGSPYLGSFSACPGGTSLQVPPGVHQIIAADTLAGCSDTVLVSVTCTISDTIQLALLLGETDSICLDGSGLTGPIVSLVNICTDGQFVDYQQISNECNLLTGNLEGTETACFVACDAAGFCDTTIVITTVSHPFPNGIFDTLTLTETGQFCFDANQLNLAGNIQSIQNICPNNAGNFVQFELDAASFCVDYQPIAVGTEMACMAFCDLAGNCDTVNITVTVLPGAVVLDTIFLNLETDTFCLPQGWLPGALANVVDICPTQNGDNVNFAVQGNCLIYNGISVGVDTACFRFTDVFGNTAVAELRIVVRTTTPQTFCDTIFIGQKAIYCLDVSELPGAFMDSSIVEICPDLRTQNVKMTLNKAENCIIYEGTEEGRDTVCLIFCDDLGYCDTTYFCFLVKPYFEPPTLGADTAYTLKGTSVVIDFSANDTIYGGVEDLFILDQPISGSVVFNLDNSFTYTPDDPYCARWDNFTYVACNPNGCDTTNVSIFIDCIELTIFTAVSPNSDGVNDVFYIAKIEDFPDNHLWVYNIWGSLVYETTAYRNNWPGTWGADTDLPDGTYYFILEWVDDDQPIVQKGYFELFR